MKNHSLSSFFLKKSFRTKQNSSCGNRAFELLSGHGELQRIRIRLWTRLYYFPPSRYGRRKWRLERNRSHDKRCLRNHWHDDYSRNRWSVTPNGAGLTARPNFWLGSNGKSNRTRVLLDVRLENCYGLFRRWKIAACQVFSEKIIKENTKKILSSSKIPPILWAWACSPSQPIPLSLKNTFPSWSRWPTRLSRPRLIHALKISTMRMVLVPTPTDYVYRWILPCRSLRRARRGCHPLLAQGGLSSGCLPRLRCLCRLWRVREYRRGGLHHVAWWQKNPLLLRHLSLTTRPKGRVPFLPKSNRTPLLLDFMLLICY